MTPEEAVAQVKDAFPFGARATTEGREPRTVDLIGLDADAGNAEHPPTLLGWAFPMKDVYFNLKNVEARDDGWVIVEGGKRTILRPLTKQEHDRQSERMEGA